MIVCINIQQRYHMLNLCSTWIGNYLYVARSFCCSV